MRQPTPAWDRFWPKVDATGDCWEWTASRTRNGYGWFLESKGKAKVAHRWAYENLVGPIPDGLQIDHLCRNRACCNPDHLDPVPRLENVCRGSRGRAKPRKTHCPQGHPYAGTNLLILGDGQRRCLICTRETRLRAKLKYKAKFAAAKLAA